MNAKVKLTAVDLAGNSVCAGMDETVEMDGVDEQNIIDGARAGWTAHWYDDERVRRGDILVGAEILEIWD